MGELKNALLSAATYRADLYRFAKVRNDGAVISFNKRVGRQLHMSVAEARNCLSEIEALTQPER